VSVRTAHGGALVRAAQSSPWGLTLQRPERFTERDMQFARFILSLIGIVLVERAYVRSGG